MVVGVAVAVVAVAAAGAVAAAVAVAGDSNYCCWARLRLCPPGEVFVPTAAGQDAHLGDLAQELELRAVPQQVGAVVLVVVPVHAPARAEVLPEEVGVELVELLEAQESTSHVAQPVHPVDEFRLERVPFWSQRRSWVQGPDIPSGHLALAPRCGWGGCPAGSAGHGASDEPGREANTKLAARGGFGGTTTPHTTPTPTLLPTHYFPFIIFSRRSVAGAPLIIPEGDDMATTTWRQHGNDMATTWRQHGDDMARTWRQHGDGMATTWRQHGDGMATTW